MFNKRRAFSLILVIAILMGSMTVFADGKGNKPRGKIDKVEGLKWLIEPEIGETKNNRVEVKGKLQIPKELKGPTKVKLTVNGYNVVHKKDGSFSKSIFNDSKIQVKVFVGKVEVKNLSRTVYNFEGTLTAKIVTELIEKLLDSKDLNLSDKELVEKVRLAYESLKDSEKKFIRNLYKLINAEERIADLEKKTEMVTLTLKGTGLSGESKVYVGTRVVLVLGAPEGQGIDEFKVNGKNRKYELINNTYSFVIKEDTTISVTYKDVDTGNVRISVYEDSTSSSNKIDFSILENFYIRNLETGEKYSYGQPSRIYKEDYIMENIPEGKYTIHFDLSKGVDTEDIFIRNSYRETEYDDETNPLVVTNRGNSYNFVKIVLEDIDD